MDHKFFQTQVFWTQQYFDPGFSFGPKIFFATKTHLTKPFWIQKLLTLAFVLTNICRTQTICWPNICLTDLFGGHNNIYTKIDVGPKCLWTKTIFFTNLLWDQKVFEFFSSSDHKFIEIKLFVKPNILLTKNVLEVAKVLK